MRCTAALTLATGLISLTDGLQLAKRTNSAPRVIGAEIQRRHVSNPVERDQQRRRRKRDTLQATLDNLETLYFANASLGTPAQSLRLHLDTGSSDLWVNTDDSDLCSSAKSGCSTAGTYSANDSSTYEYVNSLFNISYVDGSGASGDYVKDTFNFGGTNLTDMQFGVGYTSTSPEGVLGIGYTRNEVAVNRAGLDAYPNLPQLLVNKGMIQSNAYSLWLNDLDASRGNILFGGVDTEKYHGALSTLPILKENGQYRELVIAMTGVGSNGNIGTYLNSNTSSADITPVLLDTGSSLTYLPDTVVDSIYTDFDAVYDENEGAAFIDCNKADSTDTLEFTFSSPTITVPMNELVLLAGYSKGQAVCILGIAPAGDSTSVLGDTFLRSAYVVYDLANNEISLAQTNYNATDSSIEEITTGTDSVPDATGVANAVSAVNVATGAARNGGLDISDNAALPMKTAMPMAPIAAAAAAGLLFAL
ncbi:putative candidapepsin-4 precursor [Diplodia seriata]|uniref:Probable aspartic-type endopeptidase OPSB n=1 Tax=Diplodia seriata TaxID=420778 RepID=A0A0G2ERP4_9PEZI|nr:putative candidapepsin-4 precursor [Diplodia seriata]